MANYTYLFKFTEGDLNNVNGRLDLEQPLPYQPKSGGGGFFRPGKLELEDGSGVDLVLYHNQATAEFMYTRCCAANPNLLKIIGLRPEEIQGISNLRLPGQLCLGSERTRVIGRAMRTLFEAPVMQQIVTNRQQENLASFPIVREGMKYQIADALFDQYGYYSHEIVLDAHHVFDSSVPVYNRKVELTLFKDKDLDRQQHNDISVAFIGDSIASGLVLKEVIARVRERFSNLEHIEVIAPFATLRGLARIARSETAHDLRVRLHVFETPLNALPPDYYYSAHFNIPELHIRPDLEAEYRAWWGQDEQGRFIADTACAGYGWSEVFFSPRKQIEMINNQLIARHGLTLSDVLRRNIFARQPA
jgi:hypothetical protein